MEIPCPLQEAADRDPHAPALSVDGEEVPYGVLDRLAAGTKKRMSDRGIEPGERVAVVMDNRREFVVLLVAALRLGAVVCPISTRLPDAVVVRRSRSLGVRWIVTTRSIPGVETMEPGALIELQSRTEAAAPIPDDRPATVVFTSGSTGSPRAAQHTFGNHYFSAAGANENIPLAPGDRWLLSLPLYHVGGLAIVYRCLLAGAAVALPAPGEELAASVARASHASMVPTQFRRLLAAPRRGDCPTKALLLGGAAVAPDLLDAAVDHGLPVHTTYGLTEMASQVATTPPGASRHELGTSGRILRHRELRIDGAGQILVRGRTRFAGYVEGPDLERPFDEQGWFATGDLGRLDEKGRLVVLGRLDNLFISGGENILPEDIEAALEAVDAVRRAVVVPVADEEFGQRPVAFVESDGEIDEPTLRAAVEAVLPRFMVPDAFHPWPEQAEGELLKVDRPGLRRRAAEMYGET